MKTETTYYYQGHPIGFITTARGVIMADATALADRLGCSLHDWLSLPGTRRLRQSIAHSQELPSAALSSRRGGRIFLHPALAVAFAHDHHRSLALWLTGCLSLYESAEQSAAHRREVSQLRRQLDKAERATLLLRAIEGSETSMLVGEVAKHITLAGKVRMGERRLFEWLRRQGYLGKRGRRYNVPMQRYVEQGLFEMRKNVFFTTKGRCACTTTPKVTGKGLVYFLSKFT